MSVGTLARRDIEFRARRSSGDEAARCPINFAIISLPIFSPLSWIMRHLKSVKCVTEREYYNSHFSFLRTKILFNFHVSGGAEMDY